MYSLPPFDETDSARLRGLIADYPLGTLVTQGEYGMAADHIPFLIEAQDGAPHGVLRAHVARANPLLANDGAEALVVFQGPSAYITPALYAEKAISGRVVPTWNYSAVHVQGRLRVVDDARFLLALLERLTERHEAARATPWSVRDAPSEYLEKIMQAIVAIEIPVARMQGKWKLSQNRSEQDRRAIEAGMAEPMAGMMRAQRQAG